MWAEWKWDGDTLTAVTDVHGFYPIYYALDAGEICLSPSLSAIVSARRVADIDWPALAAFLRIGFFLGDDTPFAGVKALPPAARLEWSARHFACRGERFEPKAIHTSREAAMDGFVDVFRTAMRRRLPGAGDCTLPLTGGRDSRRILLELNALGERPRRCVTHRHYPPRPDEDVRIAAMLAGALGIPHDVVDQVSTRFDNEWRKNVLTGFCSNEHAQTLVVADHLRGRTDTTYDGIAGMLGESFLMNVHQADLFARGDLDAIADNLFEEFGPTEDLLKAVLTSDAYRRIPREEARARLVHELRTHVDAPNPIASFHFWNRTRREISLVPFAILADIPRVYAPYLDEDVSRFLLSLPFDIHRTGTFHTDTIRRAYPEFAAVPFEDKTVTAQVDPSQRRRYIKEFLARYWRESRCRSRLVQNRFVLPRYMAACAAEAYSRSSWWLPLDLVTYLIQLERFTATSS